jgi:hypothetical protein
VRSLTIRRGFPRELDNWIFKAKTSCEELNNKERLPKGAV